MDIQKMIEEIQKKIADKYKKYIEGCQAFSDICGVKGDDGKYKCQYCRRWNGQDRYVDYYYTVSLSRVLSALEYEYTYVKGALCEVETRDNGSEDIYKLGTDLCERKVLKEDGSDAMLSDQSDDTIFNLYNIIIGKT